MALTITFDQAKQARAAHKELPTFEMDVRPHEIAIDATKLPREDSGKPAPETVTLIYKPFTSDEYSDVLEDIKAITDAREWVLERNYELLQRCLVQPEIPATAEGRKWLEQWMPGTVVNVADQIQSAAGYRSNYAVRDAKEALGNSVSTTQTLTSPSK